MEGRTGAGLDAQPPFSRTKCVYCDFVSYGGSDDSHAEYLAALVREIAQTAPLPVRTTYIGGRTPTLPRPSRLSSIIEAVTRIFPTRSTTEITVEANLGLIEFDEQYVILSPSGRMLGNQVFLRFIGDG